MRKTLSAFAVLLAACGTPAYRAPEVPVPSTYSVGNATPAPAELRTASEDVPTSAVHVSTALATTPFWTDLGDSTLAMLIREAQRANMDVRGAQSRLTRDRKSTRLNSSHAGLSRMPSSA